MSRVRTPVLGTVYGLVALVWALLAVVGSQEHFYDGTSCHSSGVRTGQLALAGAGVACVIWAGVLIIRRHRFRWRIHLLAVVLLAIWVALLKVSYTC